MRELAALVLAALLVTTAGCGALESSDDREPYGVDEVTGADSDSELLPGLTTDGVTDRIALRNAHVDALENDSYRRTQRTTVRRATGDIETVSVHNWSIDTDAALFVDDEDPVSLDSNESGIVSQRVWVDRTVGIAVARTVDESGTVSYQPAPNYVSFRPTTPVSLLDLYGAVETVTVDRADGAEWYRLEGTGALGSGDDVSFELLLSEAGYVESYHIEVTRTSRGDRVVTEYVGGFDGDADVDLEEPDWVEEARAELESRD